MNKVSKLISEKETDYNGKTIFIDPETFINSKKSKNK